MSKVLKIGTRGSPLALAQTEMVRAALAEKCPDVQTEVVVIKTSGDWNPADGEKRLSDTDGGKGQFAKEIEQALLAGDIDAAVHSMKDMDSTLPDGLILDHMLPREDPRDALLLRDRGGNGVGPLSEPGSSDLANCSQLNVGDFDAIPQGATVGTASVRRAAFLLSKRPDLKIVPFRGNVQTRIEKLRDENSNGDVECTLLALAGLRRLGIEGEVDIVLEPEQMLPAAAQGAVGIELRADDQENIAIFSHILHFKTVLCVKAEREVLRVLDGSCHTPIGAYAVLEGDEMRLRVRVSSLDGVQNFEADKTEIVKSVEDALAFGNSVGHSLKEKIPEAVLNAKIEE